MVAADEEVFVAETPDGERWALGQARERARTATRKRRRIGIAAAAVVVLIALGMLLSFASGGDTPYDPSARAGMAPNRTPEEIQAELDRTVEEGMFDISIAGSLAFESSGSEAEANIENVPGNRYDMRVSIALEDGEEVYRSGAIAPGTWIEKIRLTRDLEPGIYHATALFEALDPDTGDVAGTAAAEVVLTVGGG